MLSRVNLVQDVSISRLNKVWGQVQHLIGCGVTLFRSQVSEGYALAVLWLAYLWVRLESTPYSF